VRDGLIIATPGNTIDYSFIVETIKQLGNKYDIAEIAFDRWGAFQIVQQLTDARFTMIEFGQGYVSMGAPMKELLRLTTSGKLLHNGNRVLRWMADNMVVSQDPSGNIKPNKQKSTQKIDGMVAGVMALDRSVRNSTSSVYDERGLLSV
jgi:phage terminase large subunit-like protein